MSSVFSHHKTTADRSASDRRRHKQKIEKAIKEGIHDIVAEESIIGQDGKKKIKIPVKGIKEYKFVYGSNNKGVGAGGGHDIKRGQKIGNPNKQKLVDALTAMANDPTAVANIQKKVGKYEWKIGADGDAHRDTLMTFITRDALQTLVKFNREALGLASVDKIELALN